MIQDVRWWRTWAEHRRHNRLTVAALQSEHCRILLQLYFRKWSANRGKSLYHQRINELATQFATNRISAAVFHCWAMHVNRRRFVREITTKYQLKRQGLLTVRSLCAWKWFVECRTHLRVMEIRANSLYNYGVLRVSSIDSIHCSCLAVA